MQGILQAKLPKGVQLSTKTNSGTKLYEAYRRKAYCRKIHRRKEFYRKTYHRKEPLLSQRNLVRTKQRYREGLQTMIQFLPRIRCCLGRMLPRMGVASDDVGPEGSMIRISDGVWPKWPVVQWTVTPGWCVTEMVCLWPEWPVVQWTVAPGWCVTGMVCLWLE